MKGPGGIVSQQMIIQIAFLNKTLPTLITSVLFNTQVNSFVCH